MWVTSYSKMFSVTMNGFAKCEVWKTQTPDTVPIHICEAEINQNIFPSDSVSTQYGSIQMPIFQVLKHQTPLFSCCYAITAVMLSLQAFEEKVSMWPKSVCTTTETVFNSSSDSSAQLWVHFHPFPWDRSLNDPPACFTWLTWLCGSYLSSWKERKEKYHIRCLMKTERSVWIKPFTLLKRLSSLVQLPMLLSSQ